MAIDMRALPRTSRPARRLALGIEIAVLGAILITLAAVYFRDPLTLREEIISPADDSASFSTYTFDDRGNGGTSVAAAASGNALAWACQLTDVYEYRYCGFGVMLDSQGTGRGIDLSRLETVRVVLHYEGSARSLRVVFRNKNARYLELGAISDEQVNQTSLEITPGTQAIDFGLDEFAVAEWWRDSAPVYTPELSEPHFNNVRGMEFVTAPDAQVGRHALKVDKIVFTGRTVSAEVWYATIGLMWLSLIGAILLHRREEASRWQARLLGSMRKTVDTIPHMVWSIDRERRGFFNRQWEEFTGVAPDSEGRLDLRRLIHRDDLRRALGEWKRGIRSGMEFRFELRVRHRSGDYRWLLARTVPFLGEDGTIDEWYGTWTDIEDRVRAQQALRSSIEKERKRSRQLKWTSEHDPLTRLPNRRAFDARLAEVTRAACEGRVGLLLIDLDYFKHLNDTLGHGAGDELLRTIAKRLKRSVRRDDFVARVGGDEFAVIVPALDADSDLTSLGNAVASAIQVPLNIGGHVVRPGVSIGGASWHEDQTDPNDLLTRADAALYAIKRAGRGGFRLFEGRMLDEVKNAARQLARARELINGDDIVVFYQPKFASDGETIAGFEALMRYKGPEGSFELPDTIAEAFNDHELATGIGEQIHRKVAHDVRRWIDCDVRFERIAINAAPAEFLRDDYAERLLGVLEAYRVPPTFLEVEVTEHAFVERGREYVGRALEVLKSAGVTISLDDFGTGHSSLSHIRDFPVDLIKIDKSYTEKIGKDEEITALVAGVIHLVRGLSLDVVAEGVETVEQLKLLRAMGCHFIQGYLLGMPVDSSRVGEVVSHRPLYEVGYLRPAFRPSLVHSQ
jgi:diguanylate cyclase (GGDEF)-like protein/PAS domain S-box-containing protein